jgi:small-conductance mechanosensitive channel
MEQNTGFYQFINDVLNYNILPLGDVKITLLSLIYVSVFGVLLIWLSSKIRDFLITRILSRTSLDSGAQVAVGTITRYVILFLGFLVVMQTVGIDLTTLNVLAGAVGIGIGFGLQNVASNFIAGLIILFERPVEVGDRIEVDGHNGKVISIGARAAIIRTNDNVSIIVPNSKFITENVVNWTLDNNNPRVRFRIPVGVAYNTDIDLMENLLLTIAAENADVLKEPAPSVRLREFGDNALNFELWVWSKAKVHRKAAFISDLNFAILKKFRAHNIEMPFPQRDLNIRGGKPEMGDAAGAFAKQNGRENDERVS